MYFTKGIAQRIKLLCEKEDITVNKLLLNCGINTSLITDLKKGRIPSAEKVLKIAKYFNVTTDYLLGEDAAMGENYRNFRESEGFTEYELIEEISKFSEAIKSKRDVYVNVYKALEKEEGLIFSFDDATIQQNYTDISGGEVLSSDLLYSYIDILRDALKKYYDEKTQMLVVPDVLKDVKVAAHGGEDDWTQEEVDEIAKFAAFVRSKRM